LFQLTGPADHDPGSCNLNRLIVLTINSASNHLDGKNTAKHEQQQTVREATKKEGGLSGPIIAEKMVAIIQVNRNQTTRTFFGTIFLLNKSAMEK